MHITRSNTVLISIKLISFCIRFTGWNRSYQKGSCAFTRKLHGVLQKRCVAGSRVVQRDIRWVLLSLHFTVQERNSVGQLWSQVQVFTQEPSERESCQCAGVWIDDSVLCCWFGVRCGVGDGRRQMLNLQIVSGGFIFGASLLRKLARRLVG